MSKFDWNQYKLRFRNVKYRKQLEITVASYSAFYLLWDWQNDKEVKLLDIPLYPNGKLKHFVYLWYLRDVRLRSLCHRMYCNEVYSSILNIESLEEV